MRRFLLDRRGATAAEYCVVLVAVLLIVVGAFRLLGGEVSKRSDKATVVLGGTAVGGGTGGSGNTVGGSVGAGTPGGATAAGGGGEKGGAGTAGNSGPTSGPGVTGGGTAVGNMGASGGGSGAGGGGGARGAKGGGGGGTATVGEHTSVATNTKGAGAVTNKGGIGAAGGGGGGPTYGGGRVLTPDEQAWAAKQNQSGGDLEDFGKQKFGRWIALVFLLMGLVIAFFTLKKSKGQMAGGTNAPGGGGSNLG